MRFLMIIVIMTFYFNKIFNDLFFSNKKINNENLSSILKKSQK